MLLWFAAFRPGIMTTDSLNHWEQANHGGWVDVQPPAYTAMMSLSAWLTDSPILLTLGQSLFLAAAIAAVARSLVHAGAPRRATAIVAAGVALTPMIGALSVALWKDIPYTACLLLATARLIDVMPAQLRGDAISTRKALASCSLFLLSASVLRQNGVLFGVALLFLSSLLLRPFRRLATTLSLALIVVVATTKVLLFPAIGIDPTPTHAKVATLSHDIASFAATKPEIFEASDRALLERVAPFDAWQARYNNFGCSTASWTFDTSFRWQRLNGHGGEVLRLWVTLFLDHPGTMLGHRLCASSVAWRPDPVGFLYTVSAGIDRNDQGLETVPISDGLHRLGRSVLSASEKPPVQWLLWRAPIWIYSAYCVVAFIVWRRRRPMLLLLVVPLAAQQLSVLFVNPAQDARYMMFSFAYAILLMPLLTNMALRNHLEPVKASARAG